MCLSLALEKSASNENQDEELVQLCLKLQNQVSEMEVRSLCDCCEVYNDVSFNPCQLMYVMVGRKQYTGYPCIIATK